MALSWTACLFRGCSLEWTALLRPCSALPFAFVAHQPFTSQAAVEVPPSSAMAATCNSALAAAPQQNALCAQEALLTWLRLLPGQSLRRPPHPRTDAGVDVDWQRLLLLPQGAWVGLPSTEEQQGERPRREAGKLGPGGDAATPESQR